MKPARQLHPYLTCGPPHPISHRGNSEDKGVLFMRSQGKAKGTAGKDRSWGTCGALWARNRCPTKHSLPPVLHPKTRAKGNEDGVVMRLVGEGQPSSGEPRLG